MSVAAQDMRDELNWSETEKGLVLSAFYWGYALGQIPASRLAAIYGAKVLYGLSVLIPSIITLLVPAACRTSFGWALFSRAILGLFESASFPCIFHFLPAWVPLNEKPLLVSVILSGLYLGEIIGFACSGYLTTTPQTDLGAFSVGGWDTVFYVFGVVGILWYPLWVLCAYERPEDHPGISAEELAYINKGKDYDTLPVTGRDQLYSAEFNPLQEPLTSGADGNSGQDCKGDISLHSHVGADPELTTLARRHSNDRIRQLSTSMVSVDGGVGEAEGTRANDQAVLSDEVPWLAICTCPAVLVVFVVGWCHGWINFTLLSEMPSYLTDQLGFDLSSAGALCTLPYIMLFCSVIASGNLFHWLQEKRDWTTRSIRLSSQFTSFGGASLGLVICGFLQSVPAAFFFMIIAQGATGMSSSGFLCAFLDIAPNHSALLNSIANTVGSVAGIVGPIVVGYLTTEYPGILGWRLVFMLTAAQCMLALVLWYYFQHSDIIPEINTRKGKGGKNEI